MLDQIFYFLFYCLEWKLRFFGHENNKRIRIRNKYTITNNKYYYEYNIIMIKCNIAKSKKLTILSYDSYDGQNPLELV